MALKFGQAEYFALSLFGMSTVTSLASKSQIKSIISLLIGIFVVTVGISHITGVERFTFGTDRLRYGVSYVPVIVGLFGMAEFFKNIFDRLSKKEVNLDIDIQVSPTDQSYWQTFHSCWLELL